MKDMKQYLHLYLGCETNLGKLVSVGCDGEDTITLRDNPDEESGFYGEPELYSTPENDLHEIKPILRKLSDMSEEDALAVTKDIYSNIFGVNTSNEVNNISGIMTEGADNVGWICYGHDELRIGVTITIDRGIEFSLGGSDMIVNQFKYTAWLLSHSFDLFNLIPEGLAIDAKTLEK